VSYLGITLIAFGTGGIKPCVVALGADQFKVPEQAKQMATYFAMFYASINCGSMVSTLVVPYLRRVECLGADSCFSLAFGLPAGLMLVALLLFWVTPHLSS
jgi:solute carrier family 15 oligopeptide transporter 1